MKSVAKIREEKKDKRKAIYASLIFLNLLILFFLLVSMDQPDPPLQEEIIEVEIDFGGELAGGSSASSESKAETKETVTESAPEVDQQEESPVVIPSGTSSSSNSTNTKPVEDTPKPDNSLGFPGGSGGNTSGNGNGTGFGNGNGHDGNGNNGQGEGTVNLKRKIIDKGGITAQSQEEGKVAIDIWVNDKGEVVKTKLNASKSNSPSQYLIGLAKKWAKTMQYEKSLGSPTQYVGYQVFSFTKH